MNQISINQMKTAIKKMKMGKAAEQDGITTDMLKYRSWRRRITS